MAEEDQQDSKENQTEIYTFSVSQDRSLAQQTTLLNIQVQNTRSKAVYSNKFTGTSIKNEGFPSSDLGQVEGFIKRAYSGETEGLTLKIDESPKRGKQGVVKVTIKQAREFFDPMVIVLK